LVNPNEPAQPESDDNDWSNGQGEAPDNSAMTALQLAHRAVAKFPDLSKRYQKFIGTAAVVSSAVIVLASIAVSRRLHRGESPESILDNITTDEIESVAKEKREKPQRTNGSRFGH
jgi:hypothetical protein